MLNMAKDKFILVSLKEDESKTLAQVLSNDTSRKILDYLADKEATESELAEKLSVPISTIHYNLQALLKGKLVEADEYHYSSKGKEVLHYKLANKYIIIAPKSTFGIKEKLRSILPAGIIAIFFSSAIYLINSVGNSFSGVSKAANAMPTLAANRISDGAISESAAIAPRAMAEIAQTGTPVWELFIQNPAMWFLFGCVFTLLLVIVIEYMAYKRKN
jgi:DNA-binding transcriptional ArsR family regulator